MRILANAGGRIRSPEHVRCLVPNWSSQKKAVDIIQIATEVREANVLEQKKREHDCKIDLVKWGVLSESALRGQSRKRKLTESGSRDGSLSMISTPSHMNGVCGRGRRKKVMRLSQSLPPSSLRKVTRVPASSEVTVFEDRPLENNISSLISVDSSSTAFESTSQALSVNATAVSSSDEKHMSHPLANLDQLIIGCENICAPSEPPGGIVTSQLSPQPRQPLGMQDLNVPIRTVKTRMKDILEGERV
jgi:hypothetical protein